jgi:hypothetical protein
MNVTIQAQVSRPVSVAEAVPAKKKNQSKSEALCNIYSNILITVRSCRPTAQLPSLKTTSCRLPLTAHNLLRVESEEVPHHDDKRSN